MNKINVLIEKKYFLILILFFAYLLAAFNSIGFYKDDEHFQILEPIAYLLGINTTLIDDPNRLYWEWRSGVRLRPWFQPYIYYHFISILKLFEINDPFHWALGIRLFNGILGFIAITYLFFSIKKYFVKKDNIKYYLIYFTFWFYPYLFVRTSSEALSIIFFIIAFSYLLNSFQNKFEKINIYKLVFFGSVLGLSIVIRPQIIFSIVPIFFWILIYKLDLYKILLVTIGIISSIFIGLYIDYLNWGFFTNTYLQIYKFQILEGQMRAFGKEPFWFYLIVVLKDLSPIFSLFFLISLPIFFIKNFKSVFTWLVLGTIIFLLFFQHKETRFIFQIYIFSPFFFFYFLSQLTNIFIRNIIFYLSLISNLIFLIIVCIFPANNKVHLYNYIHLQNLKGSQIYYVGDNPYLINEMEPTFYTSFLPKIKKYNNQISNDTFYLVTNNYLEYEKIRNTNNCKLNYTTYPLSIFNLHSGLKKRKMNWFLFKCN